MSSAPGTSPSSSPSATPQVTPVSPQAATTTSRPTGLDLQTQPIARKQVISWAMYDWALQPFNTVILTFVFTAMYLVSDSFIDPVVYAQLGRDAALAQLSSGLGLATTIAGVLIACVAPVLGQWADASGRRKAWVFWSALALLAGMAAMFFVQANPAFFWLGAGLVAVCSVLNQINETNYNAMIVSVSTPSTIGRVSGLGWGLGYSGGVVALVLIAAGDMLLGSNQPNGMFFRVIALGCVLWAFIFGWPLFTNVPQAHIETRTRSNLPTAYKALFATIKDLHATSRTTFWFLISSAVFRDGLSGVFAFGAVLASAAFGFDGQQVLIFGIAANLVAGVSTIAVGRLDDKFGARRIIIAALTVLVVTGVAIVALHQLGPIVFWVGGLLLCCTVGPAQAAARSFLARNIPAGRESEMFALYATTGKAASFMAPAMWTLFIALTGATIWGTLGILLVVATGLLMFVFLREPAAQAAR